MRCRSSSWGDRARVAALLPSIYDAMEAPPLEAGIGAREAQGYSPPSSTTLRDCGRRAPRQRGPARPQDSLRPGQKSAN